MLRIIQVPINHLPGSRRGIMSAAYGISEVHNTPPQMNGVLIMLGQPLLLG